MKEYIQVSTTTEKREDANRIARSLVEKRLAACAQVIGPVKSTYWWNGKMDEADEWLCIMKTRREIYTQLEKELKAIHPYEVPEITAIALIAGMESYLRWIEEETSQPRPTQFATDNLRQMP
jgi:periplasmic divalent cation tolerance protein